MRRDVIEAYTALGLGPRSRVPSRSSPREHSPFSSAARSSSRNPQPKKTALDAAFARLEARDVIAAEHTTEIKELVDECHVTLKNLYRSKLVLGGYLQYFDPNYGSDDALANFNLPNPAPFESYGNHPTHELSEPSAEVSYPEGTQDASRKIGTSVEKTIPHEMVEKMKNSEELIRKLYKKNTQLEAELLYYKNEVIRLEKQREQQAELFHQMYPYIDVDALHERVDHCGFVPNITANRNSNSSPTSFYTGPSTSPPYNTGKAQNVNRRGRSLPPTRVLLRSCYNGEDIPVLSRDDRMNVEGDIRDRMNRCDRDGGVQKLRDRTLELTTCVVQLQHANDRLRRQRDDQDCLKNRLLKAYFRKRDGEITHMHRILTSLQDKINNPTKVSRIRTSASQTVSAAVTATSILKQTNKMLQEEILHNLQEALVLKQNTWTCTESTGDRRRALLERMKPICDALPTSKRRDLLAALQELKTLYSAMNMANETLENKYKEDVTEYERLLLQKKIQIATLKDRLQMLTIQNALDQPSMAKF